MSVAVRPLAPESNYAPLVVAAMVLFAFAWGASLALGELTAFYVVLSFIGCLAVFFDFRFGAVLLMVLLPMESTTYFPHSIGGVVGLNPLNLLEAATLVSLLVGGRKNQLGVLAQPRLFWMYVVPIVIAGLMGARHVQEIPSAFYDQGQIDAIDAFGYLRDFMVKPLTMVLVALIVAAAVAKSQKPQRFLAPIFASIVAMALFGVVYVVASGIHISELASAGERNFFSAMGLHANDLGRLFAVAYALLLFTWWESKQATLKITLVGAMGLISLALLLTFSRGAFLGFAIVNLLFLLWKFNARTLGLALVALAIGALFMPGAVYDRVTLGFTGGGNIDAVTAGRWEGIWLPLIPELFKSPLWGNGLSSIMWAEPMRNGSMLLVGHPHNAYIEVLLDMGLAGLVLLCGYYAWVWKRFRDLGSNAYLSPELRGFFQGATAALVSFAVTGWAGSSLVPRPEYVFLWMAIGMMYGMLARKPAAS